MHILGQIDTDKEYTNTSTQCQKHLDPNADELSLKEEEVIPFPREYNQLLMRELLNVFSIGCVIIMHPGAGESV